VIETRLLIKGWAYHTKLFICENAAAQFAERKRSIADTVADIAFIAGETNRAVGAASPDAYLSEIESQCIEGDWQVWRIDEAEEFCR
jgi:hypothetical protein